MMPAPVAGSLLQKSDFFLISQRYFNKILRLNCDFNHDLYKTKIIITFEIETEN